MSRMDHKKLWVTIAACILVAICQVTAKCPSKCVCKTQNFAFNIYCQEFFDESEAVQSFVRHFEISNAPKPLSISENTFTKLGLSKLDSITISNSSIASIDKMAFAGLKDLTDLKILHSNLSALDADLFINNQYLKKLKLSGNPLKFDTFPRSGEIEELELSHCNLTAIDTKSFKNNVNIVFLDLSNNQIQALADDAFIYIENLQEIRLGNNELTEVSADLFKKNPDLDSLDLSGNPISILPEFNTDILMSLNLKSCQLKYINNKVFKNLVELDILDLSNNDIMHIDTKAFSKLKRLTYINLSGNKLRIIDENLFVSNPSLKKLNLDNNPLITLPRDGFKQELRDVYYFSCNNCTLRSLPEKTFSTMPGLVALFLSHNRISDVSTGVFHNLKDLIELDLSHNQISTIDDQAFRRNTDLKKLSLSGNPLKALHSTMFIKNVNIRDLDLSQCGLFKLWTVSAAQEKLYGIESLNISGNRIPLLTVNDIQVTENLKSLDLGDNPLTCSEELKNLTTYLDEKDIKRSPLKQSEEMLHEAEVLDEDEFTWKKFVKAQCPGLVSDDDDEDDDDDDDDEDDDDDDIDDDDSTYFDDSDEEYYTEVQIPAVKVSEDGFVATKQTTPKQFRDSMHLIPDLGYYDSEEEEEAKVKEEMSRARSERSRYSFMWPALVFTGTALLVLGVVAKSLLYIIRRRKDIPVTRFIRLPKSSKLKKNSNLVYQQLSEEKDSSGTPVLSRFTLVPSVHANRANTISDHV